MHTALLLIALLFATTDAGAPQPREDVFTAYLKTHDLPGTAAELRALGDKPESALMRLCDDKNAEPFIRARAMSSLRNLPSPAVRAFVARWLEIHAETVFPTERIILRRAAMTLGWLGGPAATERLALLFGNDDAEVRLEGVLALGVSRAPRAAAILRRQERKETDPRVREQIQKILASMDATTAPEDNPPPRRTRPIRTEF